MLNRKNASSVSASSKSFELGNGGMNSAAHAARLSMAPGSSTPVRHTHPRFLQNAAHGAHTLAKAKRPSRSLVPALESGVVAERKPALNQQGIYQALLGFCGVERESVRCGVRGSWRSPLSITGRVLDRLILRLTQDATSAFLHAHLVPAAGTPRQTPRLARAWVFSS